MYVDDILAHVDKQEAENLGKKLIERFGTMPIKDSSRLSYLGMQLKMVQQCPIYQRFKITAVKCNGKLPLPKSESVLPW